MKYLKNKLESILFKKKYNIDKKENGFYLNYKNQNLGAFDYITNQTELFGDYDTRGINKIPTEYLEKNAEIFLGNKNIFLCFAKRKNIKKEDIFFLDIINIELETSQRIQISKINFIFNYKKDENEFLFINYILNDEQKTIILDINSLKVINEYSDSISDIKFNYFIKNNDFYKLKYISKKEKDIKHINDEFYFEIEKINELYYTNSKIDSSFSDFFVMQTQISKDDLIYGNNYSNRESIGKFAKFALYAIGIIVLAIISIEYLAFSIFMGIFLIIFANLNIKNKFIFVILQYAIIIFLSLLASIGEDLAKSLDFIFSITFVFFIIISPIFFIIKAKKQFFETQEIKQIEKHIKKLDIKKDLERINYKDIREEYDFGLLLIFVMAIGLIVTFHMTYQLNSTKIINLVGGNLYALGIIFGDGFMIYLSLIFYKYLSNITIFFLEFMRGTKKLVNSLISIFKNKNAISSNLILKDIYYDKYFDIRTKLASEQFILKEKKDGYYKLLSKNENIEFYLL